MDTKKNIRTSRNEHTSLFILHAAIAVLEQLPSGTGVSAAKLTAWKKGMRAESQKCLERMDAAESRIANDKSPSVGATEKANDNP